MMSTGLKRIHNRQQLPESCRLFVGLWPEDSLQPTLATHASLAQQQCGGRLMSDNHWHITLAYLGACQHSAIERIIAALQGVELCLEPITLSRYGSFKKAGVVWLGPEAEPSLPTVAALHRAHTQLWAKLGFLNAAPERDYIPHVSLLRNAQAGALNLQLPCPLLWRNQACYLIASFPTKEANQYVVLHELSLR